MTRPKKLDSLLRPFCHNRTLPVHDDSLDRFRCFVGGSAILSQNEVKGQRSSSRPDKMWSKRWRHTHQRLNIQQSSAAFSLCVLFFVLLTVALQRLSANFSSCKGTTVRVLERIPATRVPDVMNIIQCSDSLDHLHC